MKLFIIDITSNNYENLDSDFRVSKDDVILSLTPSASYFLETRELKFITFHNLISIEDFKNKILTIYDEILLINDNKYINGFFRDIAQFVNYFLFLEIIVNYANNSKFDTLHYVTDKIYVNEVTKVSNATSLMCKYINFDNIKHINKIDNRNKINFNYFKKYSVKTICKKVLNKLSKTNLNYDWIEISPKVIINKITTEKIDLYFDLPMKVFKSVDINKINFKINNFTDKSSNFKTFLGKNEYLNAIQLKEEFLELYFFQHGNYLYKNIFIKYSEIELASINFVFNDYTKKLFENLNAKKVYSVGSILFNKPTREIKKQYDFLYITQGHDYLGNLQYVDFPNSLHSFDGYELYQRHKNIIKLFGTKFKDKKIMIRVHPCVVTTGVYVPFWELAGEYKNITIDVSIPIYTLIEKSKYIISDYFTTEFINRELHYKRDIILFQGTPTPLPIETIEDMKKMFILVDTIDDLEDKVNNIEEITKNRKRYDDIIEYYSSKKCDTKKIVTEILEKEFNARR
jgi:hypothetical protein